MLRLAWAILVVLAGTRTAADPVITVVPDVESGVYEPGHEATWTIQVKTGAEAAAGTVRWVVRPGGAGEQAKGESELSEGRAKVTATRTTPGMLLLEVKYKPAGAAKDLVGHGGAAFAPEKIVPSAPPPADFDQFWKEKIAELEAIPMNVQLTPVDLGDPGIEYWKITLDNIRGTKIHGQIAKPKGKDHLPALLQVQWAGVYPLDRGWVKGYAHNGWLSMNILAHDLPIDEPAEFYKEKSEKELADYPQQGSDDREKSYFLRMFLSCYRAVEYLTQRPDWNKGALVVHGGSQGGYQAIVTAGMHPAVTAMAANVPAGCDHTGKRAGRAYGWPGFGNRTWMKDVEKRVEVGRYFDAMNFAPKFKGPAIVGVGLIDTTCPPEGIYAAVNQLSGPKQIVLMPLSGHGGPAKAYEAVFGPFLEEQKKTAPK
jgi:cephalosporin-C deacetylase-like acetyl esterase